MNIDHANRSERSRVLLCESGRWLALSTGDKGEPRIGVFGDTEEQARDRLREAMAGWLTNLKS